MARAQKTTIILTFRKKIDLAMIGATIIHVIEMRWSILKKRINPSFNITKGNPKLGLEFQ